MLVNHLPSAHDLQAFLVFSQHSAWVYHAGKPRESVVYCLSKSKGEFDMIKDQSMTIIIIYYMISEEWW